MHRADVDHLPYSAKVKAYLATQMDLEYALKYLLERLEEKGIAERTLIVLTADHYPYGLTTRDVEELAGYRFSNTFGLHKNACIIYVKGMEPDVIKTPTFVPDILPTVSNLLGLPFDSRFLSGRDVFSDAMPLVYIGGNFMTDLGFYERGRRRFTPFDDNTDIPEGYVSEVLEIIKLKRSATERTMELDYFAKIAEVLKPPVYTIPYSSNNTSLVE